MSEIPATIEQFKDPRYPIYWIHDRSLADQLYKQFATGTEPCGQEFGPGYNPSNLWQIDPHVNLWLLTDPDKEALHFAKRNLPKMWKNSFFPDNLPPEFRMFVFNTRFVPDYAIEPNAPTRTLVYRNPKLDETYDLSCFPHISALRQNQRVVLIVNSYHLAGGEDEDYKILLRKNGYDSGQLRPAQQNLSWERPDYSQDCLVFDSHGILNNPAS